jgi:ribulose bisphosphate carboxylase small subunit
MEVKYSLYVNGYEDKERIVEALTNSGYIVGAELEKDRIFGTKGWRIDIYNEPDKK